MSKKRTLYGKKWQLTMNKNEEAQHNGFAGFALVPAVALHSFSLRHRRREVQELEGPVRAAQKFCDHGLVLNRVEAAGRVGHEAARLEQRRA